MFANNNQSEPSATDESTNAPSGEIRSSVDRGVTVTEPSVIESSAEQKSTPTTPTISVTPSDPWATFTRTNAWDDVPGIEKYVDNLPWHRRNKSQGSAGGPGSPGGSGQSQQQESTASAEWRRRGSKLTDFPTAVERPSLPVTPAPIRRPQFFDDDDDDEKLPTAEGVPRQSDWVCAHGKLWTPADCPCDLTNVFRFHKDPIARLQLLAKQQSEVLFQKLGPDGPGGEGNVGVDGREIQSRPLPFGSEDIVSPTYAAQASHVLSPQPVKPGARPRSILGEDQGDASSTTIQEPSFHGPGLAWEKDEGFAGNPTAMPPSEEDKDVLET